MTKVNFSYDLKFIVKTALQIFIEKQENLIVDKSKLFASYDIIHSITDEEIENLLEKWSEMNNGKTTIFEDGLNDAEQMWNIIWESDRYINQLEQHICSGFSGIGVYDKTTKAFHPCKFSCHYDAIKKIIENNHKDLWEKHQAFSNGETEETSEIDDFILNNLVLIGNRYNKDYYTVKERLY